VNTQISVVRHAAVTQIAFDLIESPALLRQQAD
jgi:hypothetical protein